VKQYGMLCISEMDVPVNRKTLAATGEKTRIGFERSSAYASNEETSTPSGDGISD
jgi:hypothetical protein